MQYGVIDIGSNSIRLSIYECEGSEITQLINKREMAGLAGYVKKDGMLAEAGIRKACTILAGYKEVFAGFGIEEYGVFATASLRGAGNRDKALEAIRRETGLSPEVLTGEEEARLDYIGVNHAMPMGTGLLCDIGGGSTELVVSKEGAIEHLCSLPVGSLGLHAKYVDGLLMSDKERHQVRGVIRKAMGKVDWVGRDTLPQMCGVGGTLRALHKLSCELLGLPADAREVPAKNVKKLCKMIRDKEFFYQTVYRIVPERIFSIQPGLMILREVVDAFGCQQIAISQSGVREGYLIDRMLQTKKGCEEG